VYFFVDLVLIVWYTIFMIKVIKKQWMMTTQQNSGQPPAQSYSRTQARKHAKILQKRSSFV